MFSPHRLQAVCRPLPLQSTNTFSSWILYLVLVLGRAPLLGPGSVTGAIISILFPTLWIRQQQDLDYMHAGGFRFYRSCLSDVRRRQWRKTGEWRLTCRIRRLRQPPQENCLPFLEGRSVHRPPPLPPKISYVTARNTSHLQICSERISVWVTFPHWGRPPLARLRRRPALSPLASCWLARLGNQKPRRNCSRTRQACQGVSILLDISQPSARERGKGGAGWLTKGQ